MHSKICVLGDGSWGTAIASVLADNGHKVKLWCYNPEIEKSINDNKINNVYFPNYKLNENIVSTTSLNEAISRCEWIFVAIPVKFFRSILVKSKSYFNTNQNWILLNKGCEKETFFFPSQILDDVFKCTVNKAVISGPSFAIDLIEKRLTAVDVAVNNPLIENELTKILVNDYFKINLVDDLIGIQIVGAFKNVIAIIMGIIKSKNYSDNTKAYIFTKCIHELITLIKFFGGKNEAILNLSGIGDLILTCFGKHSKNLKLGLELGLGKNIKNLSSNMAEGINTIESIHLLIKKNKLSLPFFEGIYKFIFLNENFEKAII